MPSLSQIQKDIIRLRQGAGNEAQVVLLKSKIKSIQNRRLSQTYKDLLEVDETRLAARFFLDRLYGVNTPDARDQQVERVIPKAEKILPKAAVKVLSSVLYMDWLAEKLDLEISFYYKDILNISTDLLEEEAYLQAFTAMGQFERREEQIALIGEVGRSLVKLLRFPMLEGMLKMTRGAAQKANLEEFHNFLSEGVRAFKSLKNPAAFFDTIAVRERELLRIIGEGGIRSFAQLHQQMTVR